MPIEVVKYHQKAGEVEQLFDRSPALENVMDDVARIIDIVRNKGDNGLSKLVLTYDGIKLPPSEFMIKETEFADSEKRVDDEFKSALEAARDNITQYHAAQKPSGFTLQSSDGSTTEETFVPMARVGLYIPGGSAPLVSTVLMTVLPAQIAGVDEIILTTPCNKRGEVDPHILYTCAYLGINKAFRLGGAQAIAALAFGTATVPKVDMIAGPGNIYVTAAKKMVYGTVAIDMLAGPSEVLLIADETASAVYIAADMLSQAEHDTLSRAILVTTSETLAAEVQKELSRQLERLARKDIASQALRHGGLIIVVDSLCEAVGIANKFAPEHLEVLLEPPQSNEVIPQLKYAGTIFVGAYTPEAVGDFIAGPNHVLPTGGSARYFSGLSVGSFMRRMNRITYTKEGLRKVAESIKRLSTIEGLDGHTKSVAVRFERTG